VIKGFRDFLLRGNVVDLAVAVVIGAAFTSVVESFTSSFLRPLIGLFGGGGPNGGTLVIDGQRFTWGAFLNAVITFVLTAAVVYVLVVLPMNKLAELRSRGRVPEPEARSEEVLLLTEIRDSLRTRS